MHAVNPRSLFAACATAAALFLAGCATAPDVRVDIDRTADFASYKTFAFADPLGTDRGGYQSIVSRHLRAATQRELESRGLRLVATAPQLVVNFNAQLNEKLRVVTDPAPPPMIFMGRGYYGYRSGMYSTWPSYTDRTSTVPYTEGTLNIDAADAARKQLVWEGVVTGSVTQRTQDNLQAAIDTAVAAAFAKYPVAAPAKTP